MDGRGGLRIVREGQVKEEEEAEELKKKRVSI